jgi:hypothetical protein
MNQDVCWLEIPVLYTLHVHLIQTNSNISDDPVYLCLGERFLVFDSLVNLHLQVALVGKFEHDVPMLGFHKIINNFR